jgi:hypothetical protein
MSLPEETEETEETEDFVTETEEAVVALIVSGLTKERFKTWFNSQEFEDWISGHADAPTDDEINQKVMDLFRVRQMLGG